MHILYVLLSNVSLVIWTNLQYHNIIYLHLNSRVKLYYLQSNVLPMWDCESTPPQVLIDTSMCYGDSKVSCPDCKLHCEQCMYQMLCMPHVHIIWMNMAVHSASIGHKYEC